MKKKKSKKVNTRLIKHFIIGDAVFALCSLLTALYFFGIQSGIKEHASFTIDRGASVGHIATRLKSDNLIQSIDLFKIASIAFGGSVQAGEYDIPAHSSTWRIAKMFARGKIASTTVIIPEGMTVRQIVKILDGNKFLTGDACPPSASLRSASARPLPPQAGGDKVRPLDATPSACEGRQDARCATPLAGGCPKDGELFPDTYVVAKGTSRAAVIDLMKKKMDTIRLGWENSKKSAPVPLKTWNEIITLASIVQKETPKAPEMPTVAGVYLNRLNKKMRLQADPTVVYAITNGLGDMRGKALYTNHLKTVSPYNTYTNLGLPPGPIANVGNDAIAAVLNPESTDYLFFVADGTGGHKFSETYDEHRQHHENWRQIKNNNNK